MQKCLGKHELKSHTEQKRAVAWQGLTFMNQQPVDRVEQQTEPVFAIHTSVLRWLDTTWTGIAPKCIPGLALASWADPTQAGSARLISGSRSGV